MLLRFAQTLTFFITIGLSPFVDGANIVVGQVAPFKVVDGPGNDLRLGLEICFEAVNREGGVNGQQISLVTKERGPGASESVTKTRELLRESNPVALVGMQGTGSMEALVKSGILAEAGIPVVGIRSGAQSLHEPANPYLFHTRASYRAEIEKIVKQLTTIGLNRIAILHENSPFGREGLAHIQRAVAQNTSMRVVHATSYEANSTNVRSAVASISSAQPQGIVAIATSAAAAEFYKDYHSHGGQAQVIALSVVDAAEVVKRIGRDQARGLVVTHLMPDPTNTTIPIIHELQRYMKKYGPRDTPLTLTIVEGYLAGKTLVQALRIAGPNPTKKRILTALESMNNFDAGGIVINFSPENHTGAKHVELAIVLASGKLMR